jgi:hypothetical protein
VRRRIERYAPADVSLERWEQQLRRFVVPAVRAAAPTGIALMEQYLRVLTLISDWCVDNGVPLDVESVLDPDTVERWASEGLKHLPSRATYRTTARRLGRMITKSAPWEPRPERMKGRKIAVPYSPEEMAELLEDAERQPTALKRRGALTLIALGAGCGLDGRWVRTVRGSDVITTGVVVRLLVGLAKPAGDGLLIGATSTHRNNTSKLTASLKRGSGHPVLSVPRLRSTWIVEHLTRGTRLPELLAAAGTTRIEPFDDLLVYVRPMEPLVAERMLRGTG